MVPVPKDSRERLVAEIAAELKERVDADTRSNRQVTEVALRKELGDHRESVLDIRLQHKKRQRQRIEDRMDERRKEFEEEMRDYRQELEQVDAEIEEIAAEKEESPEVATPDERYAEQVGELLDKLENGELGAPRLQPILCEDIADDHGKTPEEVHEDAKQRAAEQDRELMNTDFMSRQEADQLRVSERVSIREAMDGDSE